MSTSKFYDVLTTEGHKTINVNNIALIEQTTYGTKITLDIKDDTNTNFSFTVNLPWSTVASDITQRDLNQSEK